MKCMDTLVKIAPKMDIYILDELEEASFVTWDAQQGSTVSPT
jgi:hypothetical protein